MRVPGQALIIIVGSAALVAYAFFHDPGLGEPCPTGQLAVPAEAVHLVPTIVQHQNWVGLTQPNTSDGDAWMYACTQGQVIGRRLVRQLEFDPITGIAEVKVATRWVDLAWLSGDLQQYQDPALWTIVYTRDG